MEAATAIVTGLVLAGVSGITTLAFKHPHAFAKLYPALNLIASAAFLSVSIWQAAVHVTWTGIAPLVEPEHVATAEQTISALTLPYVWICAAYAGLLAFFWINLKLPKFIATVGKAGDGG